MKRNRLLDLLAVTALAAATWKFTHHFGAVIDLPSDDDVVYLRRGMRWWQDGVPLDPAWGPLYAMLMGWFAKLRGSVSAYYTYSRLLIGALPIAAYALMRRFIRPPFALGAAFFILIAEANWAAFPKVNHLATLLLFSFYAGSSLFRDRLVAFAVAGMGFSLAAYVRPEYALATLLLAGAFCFLVAKGWRQHPAAAKRWQVAAGMAWGLVSLIPLLSFGLPSSTDRSWLAFRQHYLLFFGDRFPPSINSWDDSEILMKHLFPKATCFSEMLWHYPGTVAGQIFRNAVALPFTIGRSFFSHVPLLLPAHAFHGIRIEAFATLFLLLAGAAGFKKSTGEFLRQIPGAIANYSYWPLWLMPLVAVGACLYTLPYVRHFTPVAPLFWLGVAILVQRWVKESSCAPFFEGRLIYAFPLLLIAATPLLNSSWVRGPLARHYPHRETVARIQSLPLTVGKPVVIYSYDGNSVSSFLGKGYKSWSKRTLPFEQLLTNVDIIIPNYPIEEFGPYRFSEAYQAFARNPAAHGFVTVAGSGGVPIWVRKERLLAGPQAQR